MYPEPSQLRNLSPFRHCTYRQHGSTNKLSMQQHVSYLRFWYSLWSRIVWLPCRPKVIRSLDWHCEAQIRAFAATSQAWPWGWSSAIPLETEPRTLSNIEFHTRCVPGHLPSMIWSLHLSSTCPRGPSPSISWRIRYTSHSHLLSGCETHSLNSGFLRLFCPSLVQGPLIQGACSGHVLPGGCALWVLSEVKALEHWAPGEHTHTTLPRICGTHCPKGNHPLRDLMQGTSFPTTSWSGSA